MADQKLNTGISDERYARPVSGKPSGGPPYLQGAGGFPAPQAPSGYPGPPGSPSWPPAPPRRPSQWLTFVTLAIALIATGLAIVGWFRPPQPAPPPRAATPTYTEQQISDAKTRACNAFEVVQKGTTLQTNLPQTDDPAMANAQATHAQLSLGTGGWYLRDHLDPATPPSVAAEVRKLANALLDVGANAIAGAKNADPPQTARMDDANSAFEQVGKLCK
jgi:hypothetical protein